MIQVFCESREMQKNVNNVKMHYHNFLKKLSNNGIYAKNVKCHSSPVREICKKSEKSEKCKKSEKCEKFSQFLT